MSLDIKVQNKCDHRVNWKSYALDRDRVSIPLDYPVAAIASFRLRINGAEIAPQEYTVYLTRESLSLGYKSTVRMHSKVKHSEPLIEANFVTFSTNCPKCLGLNNIDDYAVAATGDFTVVEKEYLLLQSVEKIIVTKVESNPFHDWYGTGLHSLIGSKVVNLDLLKTKVVEQISAAIEDLKSIQRQMLGTGRQLSPGELFGSLLNITVEQTEDPTVIEVVVSFTSQSNRNLEYLQFIDLSTPRERVAFS